MSGINAYNPATGPYRAPSAGGTGSTTGAGSTGSTGSAGSTGSQPKTSTGSATGSFGNTGSTGSAGSVGSTGSVGNNKDANKATNDLLDATGKYLDAVLEYRKKVDNELTITYDDEEETVTIDELIETMSAIHDALKKEAGK